MEKELYFLEFDFNNQIDDSFFTAFVLNLINVAEMNNVKCFSDDCGVAFNPHGGNIQIGVTLNSEESRNYSSLFLQYSDRFCRDWNKKHRVFFNRLKPLGYGFARIPESENNIKATIGDLIKDCKIG